MGLMWSVYSYFWPASVPDHVDPATGLTAKQKEIIKRTWGIVRKTDLKSTSVAFFLKFFEAHPEYQQRFKGFADVPLEDLPKNRSLRAHALNVIYTLTLLVDSLDDLDVLLGNLKRLAVSHGKLGFSKEDFDNLAVILVEFLRSALGPKNFDDEAKQAWIAVLQVVNSVIGTEMEASLN